MRRSFITATVFLGIIFPIAATAATLGSPNTGALTSGLVAYWPLDGAYTNWATGTTLDLSGSGANGSLTGLATTTAPTAGKIGQAFKFNGSTSYITTGYTIPAQSSGTSFTWSVWAKLNSGNSNTLVIMGFRNGATWVKITPTAFEYSSGTIVSYSIPTGTWVQLTVVKNGSNFTYYANGAVVGTASSASSVVTHAMYLGGDPGFPSDGVLSGYLDDARVYNRALSVSEVALLYAAGKSQVGSSATNALTSGLIAYWTMDGSKINWNTKTITDSSGNGRTATMNSFATATTTAPKAGKIGQAIKFNGNYLSASLPSLSDYTISFWAYPTNCGSAGEIQFFDSPADNVGVSCKTGGIIANWAGGASYPLTGNVWVNNQWQLITVTSQSSANKIYINGALSASGTASNSFASGTGYIATVTGGGRGYVGLIDDFRIYNRALSATEVAQLYASGAVTSDHSNASPGVASTGLVGYWTFDGPNVNWRTGQVTDSSGNGNTGNIVSLATTTAPTQGKVGQALKFSGSNYIRSTSNVPITGNVAMTLAAWVKFNDITTGFHAIIDFGATGLLQGFSLFQGANGAGAISVGYYGSRNGSTAAGTVSTGRWYHLVAVKIPGDYTTTTTLYINGVAQSLTFGTAGTPNVVAGPLYVGNDAASEFSNSMAVDDVRVYNRALSASEVQALYKAGK